MVRPVKILVWFFSIVITVLAIAGKLIDSLLVPENPYSCVALEKAMVSRGEVGLVFAELGRISGIFDNDIYAGMVIVIAYTTLLSPFWIRLYYRHYGYKFATKESKHKRIEERRIRSRKAFDKRE